MGASQQRSGNKRPSFTEKKAWGRAQQEIGAVLDPEAMQPIVRLDRAYTVLISKGQPRYEVGLIMTTRIS